jgi:hypothetical protein
VKKPVARLNKEKGYFYLGKDDKSAGAHLFEYQVQLIFGKNMEKAVPKGFVVAPGDNFQMSYDFFDCEINSAAFEKLDTPKPDASTATAKIRATVDEFAKFAGTFDKIVVKLVCGKVSLARAEVIPQISSCKSC